LLLTEESPVPPSIWKQQLGWAGQWALRATLATLCAWLATAPAVAWHMGRFSTLSLLVNLFALPLLFVSMIAGFATLTASFISAPLAAMLGWVTSEIFGLLELLTRACAGIPGSSVDLPRPALATILIYAALMLWIWFAHSRRGEVRGLWLIAAACPLILLSNVLFQANVTAPELTIFDLGRGRAALLETPNGSALIDAGGRGQGLRLAETLRRRGTRKLALLVLTSDEPEALDGALDLAAHVPIARVILPRCKAASAARRELEALLTGKGIDYGTPAPMEKIAVMPNVTWEFCDDGPAIGQPAANHSVLCVRVRSSTFTALLADARSSASLKRLLAKRADGWSADILRLIPGDAGTWPQETNELIARAGSKVIVAGTFADAEELPGVDFDKLDARIFSPRGDGTVRIRKVAEQMDVWGYRGEWKKLE
jgi:beta-lactamase superfamily II metal-dependent hydrolase